MNILPPVTKASLSKASFYPVHHWAHCANLVHVQIFMNNCAHVPHQIHILCLLSLWHQLRTLSTMKFYYSSPSPCSTVSHLISSVLEAHMQARKQIFSLFISNLPHFKNLCYVFFQFNTIIYCIATFQIVFTSQIYFANYSTVSSV